jgi:hypothetical protein
MDAIERSEGSGCVWVVLFLAVVYGCETRSKVESLIDANKPVAAESQNHEEEDR